MQDSKTRAPSNKSPEETPTSNDPEQDPPQSQESEHADRTHKRWHPKVLEDDEDEEDPFEVGNFPV